MFFLGGLLEWLESQWGNAINHFPLITLLTFSLDKTMVYYMIFLVIYLILLFVTHTKRPWTKIVRDHLFFIYLILLLHLTALRYDWQWWQADWVFNRSLTEWQLIPLIDTVKLVNGDSVFSFWYNFLGNVVWFMPFGFFMPQYFKKNFAFFQTLFLGFLLSFSIEWLQFFLVSGVSHVDDILFNLMGTVLGYFIYDLCRLIYRMGRNHHVSKIKKKSFKKC